MKTEKKAEFIKKKRPISRKFWSLLALLPQSLRKHIIRSKFEVSYDLSSDIILKQAETEDEIYAAFRLVHDAYVDLGYIDTHPERVRFTEFFALPTTVILVAKYKDDVIGTISIILDTALKLPADTTWNLDKFRSEGQVIGEVASLAISNKFKMRRGTLLLPLCKLMYEYATYILKLDGIVVAATHEVEPFYTDILLFEKVVHKTGQAHNLVKGNKSTCCYLPIGEQLKNKYKKVYSSKSKSKNLFEFFFTRDNLKNIKIPEDKKTVHAYLNKKNKALDKIFAETNNLTSNFDDFSKRVIQNLKPLKSENDQFARDSVRLVITHKAWIFQRGQSFPIESRMIDITESGFQIRLLNLKKIPINYKMHDQIICVLEVENNLISCTAEVRWIKSNNRMGCQVMTEDSIGWLRYVNQMRAEINSEQHQAPIQLKRVL